MGQNVRDYPNSPDNDSRGGGQGRRSPSGDVMGVGNALPTPPRSWVTPTDGSGIGNEGPEVRVSIRPDTSTDGIAVGRADVGGALGSAPVGNPVGSPEVGTPVGRAV